MKRAQSALENLMTYGWAILIIIIVAAALYAMGVFNPAAWSGKRITGLPRRSRRARRRTSGECMQFDSLSNKMIGPALEVYKELGPGLLENAYKQRLIYELFNSGITRRAEVDLPVT